jgi:hypothetical protein
MTRGQPYFSDNIFGLGKSFDIHVMEDGWSLCCVEETA